MAGATSEIIVHATPKEMYEAVSDFENYPEFMSDVKEVNVKKKGKKLEVEFKISVIKTFKYTLSFDLTPNKKIEWSFVDGDIFKDNKGSWILTPEGKDKTKAIYNIEVEFGIFVPSMITNKLIGSNLPAMMKKFKDRAESLAK
ncbi:MAG: SRPBCC family protein [Deltaproteobacteria bacterium]|nr:MAG: SRPBCC family protein [Deltaproteobacteria bacterium]